MQKDVRENASFSNQMSVEILSSKKLEFYHLKNTKIVSGNSNSKSTLKNSKFTRKSEQSFGKRSD